MSIIEYVDEELKRYADEHHGEQPLFIVLPVDAAEELTRSVQQREGYGDEVVLTTYRGSKILGHDMLKEKEIRLTNELPETSS